MKTTIGIFKNRIDAERAIHDLKAIGIPDSGISYVHSGTTTTTTETRTEGDSVGSGAAAGAGTGAVIGAIAGLAVAAGVIPGLGALIVAGPLAAALGLTGAAATTVAGAITGAVAGGLIGALVNLGVPEEEARIYEGRVKEGDVLVYADSATPEAREIFVRNHAEEIRQY